MVKYNVGILIYNENAGKKEKGSIDAIFPLLSKFISNLKTYTSKKAGDIEEKCSDLGNAEVVILMGGDGSLHELVNGFYKYNVNLPIGVIPTGTFNDFSNTLNISSEPLKAANDLIDAMPIKYDAILNNNRIALNFWTIGLPVHNAQAMKQHSKKASGKKSYLELDYLSKVIRYFFNPDIFKYRIVIDGYTYTGKSSMIIVANGVRIGGIPIPLEDISACDGHLNIFIAESKGLKLLTDFLGNKNTCNWNQLSNFVKQYKAHEVNVMRPKGRLVDTDGEIYQTTPSKMQILPARFTLLTSNPSEIKNFSCINND